MAMWQAVRGRELWEQSKASGAGANEHHMRATPVSSPKEELWKDKSKSDESG